jgi:hypothetical protein
MPFDILTVRTADANEGYLFPVLGEGNDIIEFEATDGKTIRRIEAHRLAVRHATHLAASVQKIRADVFVTDARVAIACEKYDKGGGWTGFSPGSMATAMAINAVSKARASRRRKGKVLVGHVRYEWLHRVGFSPKRFGSDEKIRLELTDDADRHMVLDIHLPKDVDSSALAQDIVQRAARFRLRETEIKPENVEKFKELQHAPALQPADKTFASYTMPTYLRVSNQRIGMAS